MIFHLLRILLITILSTNRYVQAINNSSNSNLNSSNQQPTLPTTSQLQPRIKKITDSFTHTDGPFYDHRNGGLYFTDMLEGKVYRYNVSTGDLNESTLNNAAVVGPKLSDRNVLIIGAGQSIVKMNWGVSEETASGTEELLNIPDSDDGSKNTSFISGRASVPRGDLWFGTTDGYPTNRTSRNRNSVLYEIHNATSRRVRFRYLLAAGEVGWNLENTAFYLLHPYDRARSHFLSVIQLTEDEKNGGGAGREVVLKEKTDPKTTSTYIGASGNVTCLQVTPEGDSLLESLTLTNKLANFQLNANFETNSRFEGCDNMHTTKYPRLLTHRYLIQETYNSATDKISSSPLYAAAIKDITGYPSGLAVDAFGSIWLSTYDGNGDGQVLQYDPISDSILRVIHMNVSYVSGLVFGGPGFSTLYATTTKKGLFLEQPDDNKEGAGAVYAIDNLGVVGFPLGMTDNW